MNENAILIPIQMLLILAILSILARMLFVYASKKVPFGNVPQLIKGFFIGLVTDTLDTWGIGSFATTTTLFKITRFLPAKNDNELPGTMSVAHAIPVMVEALFFITAIKVELTTLIPMTTAAFLGALFGSNLTKNWKTNRVRRVLGALLILATVIMVVRLVFNIGANVSESVHGLTLPWLIAGVVFNFVLGVLMTMGLGNYAPELVFFSLAGVNPLIALPVMMLDAAAILLTSAHQFIHQKRVFWPGLASVTTGGVLGVIFAATIVTTLNLQVFKIATIAIVAYTGGMLIYESIKN
ncbi:MAG: sulfite exporter TauE/SafE family protein [Streptococcaceae bacterium]|nr:sulfite exporter TauE/SafE family protein [Streptococcaceae bacterium]